MKALRIIIGSLDIGGTEKHLSIILPLLVKQGWRIKIIVLQMPREPNLIAVFTAAGITIKTLNKVRRSRCLPYFFYRGLNLFNNVLGLWQEFRCDRFTITHFFLPQAYVLGMIIAWLTRLPAVTVMSRRSLNYYQLRRSVVRWLELFFHRKVNFILGNSERIMQQLHREEGVPKRKLLRIYNGIDVNNDMNVTVRHALRATLNIEANDLVFIVVANLIYYKGHEDLLHALYLIQAQLPAQWKLLCVGRDDGMLTQLQQLADQFNLSSHIFWLGMRADVSDLLASADIGVLCSHEEGFSNAILEAMSAGLPMVVTDVGGNAEAVIHNETGFVVPAKQPVALAQALLQLVQNQPRAHTMGKAGQARVKTYFSLGPCVAAYDAFYNQIGVF